MIRLCEECRTRYSVWIDSSCIETEIYAAEELSRLLMQVTEANFAFLQDTKRPDKAIIVGSPDTVRSLGIEPDALDLGTDGFAIRVVGESVLIFGGRPRGTLYGVYAFLERFGGCRWYTPSVSKIPLKPTIEIESDLNIIDKPAFEYRESFFVGNSLDGNWAAHNRCNGNAMRLRAHQGGRVSYFPFVHTFNSLLSPDEFFDEHPEYFSLVDGKRQRNLTQLCLSNPDVVRIATERVKGWIKAHPEATIFSVSQNDVYNPCQCPECARIDAEEGSHAGSLIRFVNQIAEEVEKINPNLVIDTLAYQYTRTPPKHIRPRRNVCVRLCSIECCFAHPLDKCDRILSFANRIHGDSFQRDLEGWAKVCDRLYIWDYVVNFHHYVMPFPNFGVLAANLRYFRRNHVAGVFEEGSTTLFGKTEFIELKSWVLAKLLWDPEQDTQALVEDFISGYYGNAALYIMEYYNLLNDLLAHSPDTHFGIYDPPKVEYLTPESIEYALNIFEKAQAAAETPAIRERVAIAALPIRYWSLLKMPSSPERDAMIDAFREDLEKRNIMQITESVDMDESIRRLRNGVTYRFNYTLEELAAGAQAET